MSYGCRIIACGDRINFSRSHAQFLYMSTLLAIMSYPGGNDALNRHWPYFLRQGADWYYVISTEGDNTEPPQNAVKLNIGRDCYIESAHLPQRMLDAITELLRFPWTVLILAEYDCLFLHRIRVEAIEHGIAAHYAGGQTWNSKAKAFYHPPWVFLREAAMRFVEVGQEAINEGVCGQKSREALAAPEGSPDVFLGYCAERYDMPIQRDLWQEYSRNSLDIPEHLNEARKAYLDNVDILHGVKRASELAYITQ